MRHSVRLLGAACAAVLYAAAWGQAAAPQGLQQYRQMMAADNPGELWELKGEKLFYDKRGPKNASLERCDFGLGPGVLKGAFAHLPRYFADTGKVQDMESRLLSCMVELQGFKAEEIRKTAFSNPSRDSDMEALATYVAAQSNGMKFDLRLAHPKEREAYALGERLFFRRNGPMDFACSTCHSEDGKRIRLQELPNMQNPQELREIVGGWPAYRGTHGTIRTMQHRLFDCNWQMRLPPLEFASDFPVALTTYLVFRANGGDINIPGYRR